jgi:hypothetical protein
MEEITLTFYDCEDDEDLNFYIEDIIACDGVIIDKVINHKVKQGIATANVRKDFWEKFKKTNAYKYLI